MAAKLRSDKSRKYPPGRSVTVSATHGIAAFRARDMTANYNTVHNNHFTISDKLREEMRTMPVRCSEIGYWVEPVGRSVELAELRRGFTAERASADRPVYRALVGPAGVGKTTLARFYANEHRSSYDLIWWITVGAPDAVPEGYRALMHRMTWGNYAGGAENAVEAVHDVLLRRRRRWLFIIDNVTDLEQARRLMPSAGDGDILITAPAGLGFDAAAVLEVPAISRDDAVTLLVSAGAGSDPACAAELADELGRLPLELEQAVGAMSLHALSLQDYLERCRSQPVEPEESVTWRLAFDDLTPAARALLHLTARLAPDNMPVGELLSAVTSETLPPDLASVMADPEARRDALTELTRLKLLNAGDTTFDMHRRVRGLTREASRPRDGSADRWQLAAAALLRAGCPDPLAVFRQDEVWSRWSPHLRAALDDLAADHPLAFALRSLMARWTGAMGDSRQALDAFRGLLADCTGPLGAEHRVTLEARAGVAYWTGETGDHEKACALYGELVTDLTRVLGADDQDTLTARGELAMWTGVAGHHAAARDLDRGLTADLTRVRGETHQATLRARAGVAYWSGMAGEKDRAVQLYAEVVDQAARELGEDHWYTLAYRRDHGIWMVNCGKAAEARDIFERLQGDVRRVAGANSRQALKARADLAWCHGNTGDAVRARDLLADLVVDMRAVLGPDDRQTLVVRREHADWTGAARDEDAARELFEDVASDMQRVLGAADRETLTTRSLAAEYIGDSEDAADRIRDLYRELHADARRALGERDRFTLRMLAAQARWAGAAGDAEAARALFEQVTEIATEVLGKGDRDTLVARAGVAHWTGEAGDPEAARDLLEPMVADLNRALGADDAETLQVRGLLARRTGEAGEPPAARRLFEWLIPDVTRVHGPTHAMTFDARLGLAHWVGEAGDAAEARDLLSRLVADQEAALGPAHRDTLRSRDELAWWTGTADGPDAARKLYERLAIDVRISCGLKDRDTLAVRAHEAMWLGLAGDAEGARDRYERVVGDMILLLGPDDAQTLDARSALIHWTGTAGDAATARDLAADLVKDLREARGDRDRETIQARLELADRIGLAADPAAARDLAAEVHRDALAAFGPADRDTLVAGTHHANWCGESGDSGTARRLLEQYVRELRKAFGVDDPDLMYAQADLADWSVAEGDPAGARDLYARLLSRARDGSAVAEADRLRWRSEHAVLVGLTGDLVRADEALTDLARTLGEDHPDIRDARAALAEIAAERTAPPPAGRRPLAEGWVGLSVVHRQPVDDRLLLACRRGWEEGDAVGAWRILADLTADLERSNGQAHPETVRARSHLACFLAAAHDYHSALEVARALVGSAEVCFGPYAAETAVTRMQLADAVGEIGDPGLASALYAEVAADLDGGLPRTDPLLIVARAELARWSCRSGAAALGMQVARGVTEDLRSQPDGGLLVARTGFNLAFQQFDQRQVDAQETAVRDAFLRLRRLLGSRHWETVMAGEVYATLVRGERVRQWRSTLMHYLAV